MVRKQVFDQYVQQHSQGAFAMAFHMLRCRDDAQDVLQDACYSMLKQATLPEDSTQFRMLLFKVVRHKVIDRLRAKKVRQEESLEEQQTVDNNKLSPQAFWQKQQEHEALNRALLELKQEQRDIILLKDWQGFSYADIANILEVEAGTVMSRLHRARLALRKILLAEKVTNHE